MSATVCQFSALALALMICAVTAAPAPQKLEGDSPHTLLDIETPNSFAYSSPLQQPDSLKSRPYFDFLSTLYHRDSSKSNLFRPYSRKRRDLDEVSKDDDKRSRRAIVFRPLFVYKQQEVRRREYQAQRRNGHA